MRAKHTALILAAGFLLLPTLSWSQFPGQGGPGGGGRNFDPDQMFDRAANGKEVIRVNELQGMQKMMFERLAPSMGLTGNEITREQFRSGMSKLQATIASGGMSFRSDPANGAPGIQGMPGMSGRPGGDSSDKDRRRDEYFKRLDRNEDGVLEYDELSGDPIAEGLQTERAKYDANSDGFIDPSEFKTYLTARFPTPEGGADSTSAPGAPKDGDERKRPTIIRAGNLPRDFPYAALDTDLDGQIGLYEWKNAGKKIAEFLPLDLNNDGFVTVDEYYRWRKRADGSSTSMAGDFALNGRGMGGPGSGGTGMMAMGSGRPDFGSSAGGQGMSRGDFGRGSVSPGMGNPGLTRGDFGRGEKGDRSPGVGFQGMGRGPGSSEAPGMTPPSRFGPGSGLTSGAPGSSPGAISPPSGTGGERGSWRSGRGSGGGDSGSGPGGPKGGDRKR